MDGGSIDICKNAGHRLAAAILHELEQIGCFLGGCIIGRLRGLAGFSDVPQSRRLQPGCASLVKLARLKLNFPKDDHAGRITQLGRSRGQSKGFGGIGRDTFAGAIDHGGVGGGDWVAEVGAALPGGESAGNVLGHSLSAEIALAQIKCASGAPAVSGGVEIPERDFRIPIGAKPGQIGVSQKVHGWGIAMIGGDMSPVHRLRVVLIDPLSVAVSHCERELRTGVALLRFGKQAVECRIVE